MLDIYGRQYLYIEWCYADRSNHPSLEEIIHLLRHKEEPRCFINNRGYYYYLNDGTAKRVFKMIPAYIEPYGTKVVISEEEVIRKNIHTDFELIINHMEQLFYKYFAHDFDFAQISAIVQEEVSNIHELINIDNIYFDLITGNYYICREEAQVVISLEKIDEKRLAELCDIDDYAYILNIPYIDTESSDEIPAAELY